MWSLTICLLLMVWPSFAAQEQTDEYADDVFSFSDDFIPSGEYDAKLKAVSGRIKALEEHNEKEKTVLKKIEKRLSSLEDDVKRKSRGAQAGTRKSSFPRLASRGKIFQKVNVKGPRGAAKAKPEIKISLPRNAEAKTPAPKKTTKKTSKSSPFECGDPPVRAHSVVTVNKTKDGYYMASYSCKAGYKNVGGKKTSSKCCTKTFKWRPLDILCSDLKDCYALIGRRARYRGAVNVTRSGRPCQSWTSQTPHNQWYNEDYCFATTARPFGKETVKESKNYCRDPGRWSAKKHLWCYTMDPDVMHEPCDIPECSSLE